MLNYKLICCWLNHPMICFYSNIFFVFKLIIKETEMYGGDNLLNTQDELSRIQRETDGWTDSALKVFRRHRGNDGKTHPDQENMIALNEVGVGIFFISSITYLYFRYIV